MSVNYEKKHENARSGKKCSDISAIFDLYSGKVKKNSVKEIDAEVYGV